MSSYATIKSPYEMLSEAINNFDTGIRYTVGLFEEPSGEIQFRCSSDHFNFLDTKFEWFRPEIIVLVSYYVKQNIITKTQSLSLIDQLNSPDKENWLIAFIILKQIIK